MGRENRWFVKHQARHCPAYEHWSWKNGFDYLRIDGKVTSGRYQIQQAFDRTPRIRLMLMSTIACEFMKTGNVGLPGPGFRLRKDSGRFTE